MAETVYILCALTGLACAGLLGRAYLKSPSRLLLWSSVCFAALAANSIIVVVDVFTPHDLRLLRLGIALVGVALLLWALITEGD